MPMPQLLPSMRNSGRWAPIDARPGLHLSRQPTDAFVLVRQVAGAGRENEMAGTDNHAAGGDQQRGDGDQVRRWPRRSYPPRRVSAIDGATQR